MSYESERVSSGISGEIWRVRESGGPIDRGEVESREIELADDDMLKEAPRMATNTAAFLLLVIFLVIADIWTVTGLDFMTHVEEKLMAAEDTDTEFQMDAIREMEKVFAYGERSGFR